MAINYGGNRNAGRIDYTPLQQGLERMEQRRGEALAASTQETMNQFWSGKMKALQDAAFSDVSDWGPGIQSTLSGLSNAGSALVEFKREANALGNKAYNLMSSQGAFNPLTFKQQYDQMISTYIPTIEAKLENFKINKGWSDRDMQRYLNTEGNENIRNFLLDHGDPAGTLKQLAKPVTPRGLIGGMGTEVWEDPLRYGMVAGGPALYGGIGAAAKGGMGEFLPGAWKGTKGVFQPLNPFGLRKGGGARNWWNENLRHPAAQKLFNKNSAFQLKVAKAHLKPQLQSEIKTVNKNNKVINKLLKNIQGKEVAAGPTARTGPVVMNEEYFKQKKLDEARVKSAKAKAESYKIKASDLGKKGQGKGAAAKGLREKFVGKTQSQLKDMAAKNAEKLKNIGGVGKKNLIAKIKGVVDKKGMGWVMRQIAKKGGMKIGARALLGGLLTGSGFGTAVGVGMNLYTLYEIFNLLKIGLKETGGVRAPSKMLFGGRTKTESPVTDESFFIK